MIDGLIEEVKERRAKLHGQVQELVDEIAELDVVLKRLAVTQEVGRILEPEVPIEEVWDPPAQPRGYVRREAYRDWVTQQEEPFSLQQMADAFGKTKPTVWKQLRWMLMKGIVVDADMKAKGAKGRRFRYVKPTGPGAAAVISLAQAKAERAGPSGSAAPVPGTGSGPAVRRPDVRALLAECEENGAIYDRGGGGHYRVMKDGVILATVPASPSDSRSLTNARATLRRKGLLS